jgi:hypothetical protein
MFVSWKIGVFRTGTFMTGRPVGLTDASYQDAKTEAAVLFDAVRTLSILLGTFIWGLGDVIYVYSHKGLFSLFDALFFFGAPPKP